MFKCNVCEKQFETKKEVNGHKLGAHKKKAEDKRQETKMTTKKQTTEAPKTLTPDQQAIAERVSAQDTDWFTIREDEIDDFSLMDNPLDLPPEAAKEQNEFRYAFRWCTRTPERIDQLTRAASPPLRWAICNRQNAPFLAYLVDDLLGCVCKLDQALLFKPWSHHVLVKKAKQELADNVDQSGKLSGKKDQIQENRDDVEVHTGKQFKIGSSDEVMVTEAEKDAEMGVQDDYSDLGDLVVNE